MQQVMRGTFKEQLAGVKKFFHTLQVDRDYKKAEKQRRQNGKVRSAKTRKAA